MNTKETKGLAIMHLVQFFLGVGLIIYALLGSFKPIWLLGVAWIVLIGINSVRYGHRCPKCHRILLPIMVIRACKYPQKCPKCGSEVYFGVKDNKEQE